VHPPRGVGVYVSSNLRGHMTTSEIARPQDAPHLVGAWKHHTGGDVAFQEGIWVSVATCPAEPDSMDRPALTWLKASGRMVASKAHPRCITPTSSPSTSAPPSEAGASETLPAKPAWTTPPCRLCSPGNVGQTSSPSHGSRWHLADTSG